MPINTFVDGAVISAAEHNANWALAVLTDTARTISVTHTFSASQTFTGGAAIGSAGARAGGTIFQSYADAATSGTSETDLISDTIAAGTLGANGDRLECVYGGSITAGTASRRWDLYLGGTIFPGASGLLSGSSAAWTSWGIRVSVIRVSASIVRFSAQSMVGAGGGSNASVRYGEITGLTLANANAMKLTASEDNGAQPITLRMSRIAWFPAA